MRRSSMLSTEFERRGIWYPAGDGEALRGVARGWNDLADFIEELAPVLAAAAQRVTENYRGESASRFGETWNRWAVDPGYLAQTINDCRRLAAAAADFGGDIDAADETLLRLLDEAIDHERQAVALGVDGTAANEWLAECATSLAGDLNARNDRREFAPDGNWDRPAGPDLSNLDPAAIEWPDPGDPTDLSIVGSTAVDFGGGQGDLGEWDLDGDGRIDEFPEPDAAGADGAGGGGAGGGGAGGGGAGDLGAGGGGGLGDLGDFGGGGAGGLGDLGDLGLDDDGFDFGLPEAGLAAAGVGAAVAGGAAASGRMPFFPMMPMSGMGGGGDDGQEPKRKLRRRLQLPLPTPAPATPT